MRTYFAMLALFLFATVCTAQDQLAHAIFVKVNGKTITQDNVVQAVRYLIRREYNNVVPADEQDMENLERAALRDLVRTILIHDEAARLNLKPDRNSMKDILRQTGLRQEDVTPTIRRMLQADDLFENIMMAEGTPINAPSPRVVKKFYNEHRDEFRTNSMVIVRTIFISEAGSRPQSYFKDRAMQVMRELEAVPYPQRTEAFAKKAAETSEDVFKDFGGLLTAESPNPWIPKDFSNIGPDGKPIFPQQMIDAVRLFTHPGELRLAVSEDGMHIMYCENLQGGQVMPWEEASRLIEYVLRQQARNDRMRAWVNRVYDRSDVRWHDGTPYEKERLVEVLLPSERQGRRM